MHEPILKALAQERHVTPTPIQAQAIPHVLAGRDLLGIAQTGTGKTAAFALPILSRLATAPRPLVAKSARILVLSPTRELSNQIGERFQAYGRHLDLTTAVVIGGVSMRAQIRALARGVDVLIATPGRLVDHMKTGSVRLDAVEILVLDEADRMLDMGFIHAIREISRHLPNKRQSLFFSATMPKAIDSLAKTLLRDPATVSVTPVSKTADRVVQHVIHVPAGEKQQALTALLSGEGVDRALVFTRTKRGADRVVKNLDRDGIGAQAIHGNKSQPQRDKALGGFRDGRIRVLVATDIAARGIDVTNITHVFNYELPNEPESYVHRIGRTARAGSEGIAISLCSGDERAYLRDIEKLTRQAIPVMAPPVGITLAAVPQVAEPHKRADSRPVNRKPPRDRGRPRHRPDHAGRGSGAEGTKEISGVEFLGRPVRTAQTARNPGASDAGKAERTNNGKGRAARIRGRRNRGAPGRELPRAVG
ncbi:MAG: DEAD/DEAH box helicase [Bauldia sp.]